MDEMNDLNLLFGWDGEHPGGQPAGDLAGEPVGEPVGQPGAEFAEPPAEQLVEPPAEQPAWVVRAQARRNSIRMLEVALECFEMAEVIIQFLY